MTALTGPYSEANIGRDTSCQLCSCRDSMQQIPAFLFDNCGTTTAEIDYTGAQTPYAPNQSSTMKDARDAAWQSIPRSSVLQL